MLPAGFINSITRQYGSDGQKIIAALDHAPNTSIRFHPKKNSAKQLSYYQPWLQQKISWCESGYWLKERPSFTLHPPFHAGAYYVQESSSLFIETLWKNFVPQTNTALRVLDVCAAPGGKSTHLLSLMNDNALLVANEVIPNRNAVLRHNLTKWGHANVVVTQNPAQDFAKLGHFFDVVLVDAPCSGEGLFRKDLNARAEWSEANVATCVARQREILKYITHCLKPNGILLYSTCTFENEENDAQAASLRDSFTNLLLPANKIPDEAMQTEHGYIFLPHLSSGEGFYVSAWQKNDVPLNQPQSTQTIFHTEKNEAADNFTKLSDDVCYIQIQGASHIFPSQHLIALNQLRAQLFVKHAGVVAGRVKGKYFVPDHALALSFFAQQNIARIDVDEATALRYLKCESVSLPTAKKGWNLLQYQDYALGWVKVLDHRVNNYFPKNWRIRMDFPNF